MKTKEDSQDKQAVPYLSPRLDMILEMIFAREADVLNDFLVNVMGLDSCEVREIQLSNSAAEKQWVMHDEPGVLYYTVVLKTGRRIAVEVLSCGVQEAMQRIGPSAVIEPVRNGSTDCRLVPTCDIVIVESSIFKDSRSHHNFRCYDKETNEECLDLVSTHILELSKADGDHSNPSLRDWLRFLAANRPEEFSALGEKNPIIKKAIQTLAEISADDNVRRLAEAREKDLRDRCGH